jgi:DNA-binding MarR family transcriptional regulator
MANQTGPTATEVLPTAEAKALIWLGRRGRCLMSEFARGLALPVSTATNIANRLSAKDLLTRTRSDEDRRIVQIELSSSGKKLHETLYNQRVALTRRMLAGLTVTEQQTLTKLLQKAAGSK